MKKALKSTLALLFCIATICATMVFAFAIEAPKLAQKSVTVNSITVYWTKVSSADGYQIQVTTDGKNWTGKTLSKSTTSFTHSSLTAGKSYRYRVRSYDKGLLKTTYSAWSNYVTTKPVPSKVTGLKVTAANNTAVKLQWNKVSGVSGYTVQYYSGGKWKTYKTLAANSIVVSGLKLGTTYNFRVAALKIVNKKNVYGPVSATLKTGPVLAAPTTVALTKLNTTGLQIQWNAAAGAKGYEIYRYDTKTWVNTKTTKGINVTGLKPGTTYSFKVRAYAGSFKGKETKVYTFITSPAKPTGVKVIETTGSKVKFSWDAVTGAAGYQPSIYSYTTKKWTNLPLQTSTTATATGLTGMTDYAVRVRAYITNSNVHKISATSASSWASYANTTTGLGAVTGLKAAGVNNKDIKLTWSVTNGATGYIIERFSQSDRCWTVYDFKFKEWSSMKDLADDSLIATTETSFTDLGTAAGETRGEVYRIKPIIANDINAHYSTYAMGDYSALVNGYTKNLKIYSAAPSADPNMVYEQRINFYKASGATEYTIYVKSGISNSFVKLGTYPASTDTKSYQTVKLYLAPETIHTLLIHATVNGTSKLISSYITFSVGKVALDKSGTTYYNYAVNGQLLYLAQAINNTKSYMDEVTVSVNSTEKMSINKMYINAPAILLIAPIEGLKFINRTANSPEEVKQVFKELDEVMPDEDGSSGSLSDELPVDTNTTTKETLTFKYGSAKRADGTSVLLSHSFGPEYNRYENPLAFSTISTGQTPKKWSSAFKSVTTKALADGGYEIRCVLKKENNSSKNHNAFLPSFDLSNLGLGDMGGNSSSSIGESEVVAKINAEGCLTSYYISSPFSAYMEMSYTDSLEMNMNLAGNAKATYAFKY